MVREYAKVGLAILAIMVVSALAITGIGFWTNRIQPKRLAVTLITEKPAQISAMIEHFQASGANVVTRDREGLLIDGKRVSCATGGCVVTEGKDVLGRKASMLEAVLLINEHPQELLDLDSSMQQLQFSSIARIGYTTPISEQYIQALFDRSVPVGVIFVPEMGKDALQRFQREAVNGAEYPYIEITKLDSKWFYFRERT